MPATYDRRVAPGFLALFDPVASAGGPLASLVDYARYARYPVDLQFRHDVKTGRDHATLYVGLTSVLNLRVTKAGLLSADVHPTHAKAGAFDEAWSKAASAEEFYGQWRDIELYLDRIIPLAAASHGSKEGAVQAALSSFDSHRRVVIDREVTPSFADKSEKAACMAACQKPILSALAEADLGFSGVPKRLGNECDALAVDHRGRLLAIEVKPQGVGSVAFVAAQALMYARMLRRWLTEAPASAAPADVVRGMVAQRVQVGLASSALDVVEPVEVVPVVAVQRGSSQEMVRRMFAVRNALAGVDVGLAPIEIYEVSLLGDLVPLDEARHADGRPRRRDYAMLANERMIAWKRDPASPLPEGARQPGVVRSRSGADVGVDYALPSAYAEHNLLPEVRDVALALFRDQQIHWHQGVRGGPSPHLRSSQVQCVNALGQMVEDTQRIIHAFGPILDIASVRDLGEIDEAEAGRFLTFEFTGRSDYFGEARGGRLQRGSQSTSVDAAFAYTTVGGERGLALVEWKFTEQYRSADPKAESRLAERSRRYESALNQPGGPIDLSGLDGIAPLFHEPLYQLVRQQLLADAPRR